jgi:ribonuclease P protein component
MRSRNSDPLASGPRQGFPRAMRLLRRVEFEAVYAAGQRRSSPQFSVFFRAHRAPSTETLGREPSPAGLPAVAGSSTARLEAGAEREAGGASRFGISVKKALGGAVVRNRIRRRIREILRRNRTEIPTGWDIVIHPKGTVARATFAVLEAELVRLLRSLPSSLPVSLPIKAPNP